jgi:hypothetical protein
VSIHACGQEYGTLVVGGLDEEAAEDASDDQAALLGGALPADDVVLGDEHAAVLLLVGQPLEGLRRVGVRDQHLQEQLACRVACGVCGGVVSDA